MFLFIKKFLRDAFFNTALPLKKMYWFVFRPHTKGAQCIVEYNGKILLERLRYGSHKWALPGGAVKKHESFEEGARREVFEEVGIQLGALTELDDFTSTLEYKIDRVKTFAAHVEDLHFEIDGFEVSEARWFDLNEPVPQPYRTYLPRLVEKYKVLYRN
jgi:8-oxo-dGTP pyrophosphatase MutT (NUDIX family)